MMFFFFLTFRSGRVTNLVRVKVDTVDGTAKEGTDYRGIHTTIEFVPGQTELEIEMEILDDDDWEPDEHFFLRITLDPNSENSGVAKIGKRHIMTIKILNDDLPGTFQFEKRVYFVKESCGEAEIVIFRECGADGDVEVRFVRIMISRDELCVAQIHFRTNDRTARDGKDFMGGDFRVLFRTGETEKLVRIPIIDDMSAVGKEEYFEVVKNL